LDIAERHDFAVVPLFLVGYRQIPGSMSWRYDRMLRSHELIIAEARRRHPELPRRIFRWSDARTKFYLGLRAISSGSRRDGVALCASAVRRDPSLLLSHWFRYSVCRGIGRLAMKDHGVRIPFALWPVDGPIMPAGWSVQRQRAFVAATRISRRLAAPIGAAAATGEEARGGADTLATISGTTAGTY
jgi:hypothetical protein